MARLGDASGDADGEAIGEAQATSAAAVSTCPVSWALAQSFDAVNANPPTKTTPSSASMTRKRMVTPPIRGVTRPESEMDSSPGEDLQNEEAVPGCVEPRSVVYNPELDP